MPKLRGVDAGETAATDSVIDKLLPNCLSRDKRKTRGDGISNALKEKQRTQSHEQGRYAEQRDKNTIERADKDPAGEGAEERKTTAHDAEPARETPRPQFHRLNQQICRFRPSR